MGDNDEVQTCTVVESRPSDTPHEISTRDIQGGIPNRMMKGRPERHCQENRYLLHRVPSTWCTVDELDKLWGVLNDVIENAYVEDDELKGIEWATRSPK
jgi:hypothetical protein